MLIKSTTKYGYLEIFNNFSKRIFPMPKGSKAPYNKFQFPKQQYLMLESKNRDITKDEFDNFFPDIGNAGIWAGEGSGITILDLDVGVHKKSNPSQCNKGHISLGAEKDDCNCLLGKPYSGLSVLEHYGLKEKALASAVVVTSPSGGLHLYYKWSDKYNFGSLTWLNQTSCKHCGDYTSRIQGIDIRNDNSYLCVLPPSSFKYNHKWKSYKLADENIKLEKNNLMEMPVELKDFLNTGWAEKHTSSGHTAGATAPGVPPVAVDELPDGVDTSIDKKVTPKRSYFSQNISSKVAERNYTKDRVTRRKAFTEIGKELAKFDNDLGLAVIGTTNYISLLKDYATRSGLSIDKPSDVNKVIRLTNKILHKHRQKKFIKHPITGEHYAKVGKFFVFLDTQGIFRTPIPRKDFTLDDYLESKGLDRFHYVTWDELEDFLSDLNF